jgi:hypothetical protein
LEISDLQRFSPDWTEIFARAGAARRIEAADRRMREETRVILISVSAVRERGLASIQTVSGRRRQVTLG